MTDESADTPAPHVTVIADVESNAQALISRVLAPGGIQAAVGDSTVQPSDVLILDVTQLRGDPLAVLRSRREAGDETPAIVLAAHFPAARLRDLFHLGVRDILLKPYRPEELCQAVLDAAQAQGTAPSVDELESELEALQQQLQRRTEEVRLLSEIGRAVVGLSDLDTILTRLAESAAFVTDAEEAHIYLAEPGTNELLLRASKQAGARQASSQRLRVYDAMIGQVFQTGEPLLHQPSSEGEAVKLQTGFLVQSMIEVPLRVGKKVVGVLGAYNRLASRAFNDHQLTLLMALADWAGVALEHASLIRRARSAGATGPISMSSPGLKEGLVKSLGELEALLRDESTTLGEAERQRLLDLKVGLQSLSSMPVAVMGKDQAEGLVHLPELVYELADALRPSAARNGCDLLAVPGPALPHIHSDARRIRQVLEALVEAAIRRAGKGRVQLEIHRFDVQHGHSDGITLPGGRTVIDGAWAAVSVVDSSFGLSPDTLRALTSELVDPGAGRSGRGLSMGEVRMIAESLGGFLWNAHQPAGTRITLALPLI